MAEVLLYTLIKRRLKRVNHEVKQVVLFTFNFEILKGHLVQDRQAY